MRSSGNLGYHGRRMDWRWLAWQVYGGQSAREIAQRYDLLLQTQYWPSKDMQQWQRQQLDEVLAHAARTVPRFQRASLRPELTGWPILNRAILQADTAASLSTEAPPGRRLSEATSGSTGEPVTMHYDLPTHVRRLAQMYRANGWGASFPPSGRMLGLWGNPKDMHPRGPLRPLYDWFYARWLIHTTVMNEKMAGEIHAEILRRRPRFLYGYVSTLLSFIHFARELNLPAPPVEKVTPTAEQCTPEARTEIESYFAGVPVLERYATREVGIMAQQCELGGWHINSEDVLLEVQDEHGAIHPSGSGRVLVTSLSNRLLPTIRYDLGDFADLTSRPCACGRTLPTMSSLDGRVAEHLLTPDGCWISSMAVTRFMRLTAFRRYRIVQDDPGHITLLVEHEGKLASELCSPVLESFARLLGPQMRVDIVAQTQILPLPGGKSPHVVNLLRSG